MRVCLNGVNFELLAETGVTRSPLAEWADQIRTDGNQLRKDRVFISSWSIEDWSGGLGVNEIKTGSTANLRRIWDAENVDTRFDQIILSPQFNTCTIVPSRGDLDIHLDHYDNGLYFFETQRAAGADFSLGFGYAFKSTSNIIGSHVRLGASLASGDTYGSICAIHNVGNVIGFMAHSTDKSAIRFGAISDISATPTASGSYAAGQHQFPQISDLGGTFHCLLPANSSVTFIVADTNAYNSVYKKHALTSVGSYISPLADDGLTMYAQLAEGIYDFDDTPSVAIDTKRSKDINGAMAMFDNKLLFKNKNSVIAYDGADVSDVGYNRNDGLPADKTGEITAMCSSFKFNFAAVKGGTYSHILSYDGAAWQYYARVPSPGLWVRDLFMSNSPDAIERLWVVYGNYGYPGYFLNPLTNPLQAATYAYVPTGHVTFPAYGGDMPEESGAYFRQKYNLGGMGGSNILTAQYGLNGAAAVTTLGVVATNEFTHTFGSPYGAEASKIMPKYILAGANSGTTPIFKQAVIEYLKDPDKRSIFDFTVDIDATSQFGRTSKEAVIGSLNFALDKKTMMPFWYGQMGTRHVKALDMPFNEDVKIQTPLEQQREGLVQVRLVEVL